MKYFAKYLPVEGKIEVGDLTHETLTTGEVMLWRIDNLNDLDLPRQVKVKLFLCSRDIQVGDRLTGVSGKTESIVKEHETLPFKDIGVHNDWFKVIGEISPDATWVKEGDEFDEYDYRYNDEDGWDIVPSELFNETVGEAFQHLYKIGLKCPTCAYFH